MTVIYLCGNLLLVVHSEPFLTQQFLLLKKEHTTGQGVEFDHLPTCSFDSIQYL